VYGYYEVRFSLYFYRRGKSVTIIKVTVKLHDRNKTLLRACISIKRGKPQKLGVECRTPTSKFFWLRLYGFVADVRASLLANLGGC